MEDLKILGEGEEEEEGEEGEEERSEGEEVGGVGGGVERKGGERGFEESPAFSDIHFFELKLIYNGKGEGRECRSE